MTNPEILEWIRTAPGVGMNPDNAYGYQCVDLADQYAQDIFGVPWPESMGGVNGARELLDVSPDKFWIRTDNDPNNPNLIPKTGDLVIFNGTGFGPNSINPYGHVAVVVDADVNGMDVIQQDGFTNTRPAHNARLPYVGVGTGPVAGWLTPREEKIVGYKAAPPVPSLTSLQRVAVEGANYRPEPNTSKDPTQTFSGGDVLNFVGFVHGEKVGDSDIWLKGIGGGFVHVSAVVGASSAGLPDLTPPPPAPVAVNPAARTVGSSGANQRSEPKVGDNVTSALEAGFAFVAKGWVKGEAPEGESNRIWFVGSVSGNYVWSGACTDPSIGSLPDLTPKAAPVTPSKPVTPTPVPVVTPKPSPVVVAPPVAVPVVPSSPVLKAELSCVTEVVPAHPDNYQVGNFPDKPVKWIPHQFGKKGVHLGSVKNYFAMSLADRQKADKNAGPTSAHFGVEDENIVQFVSLRNRAYSAGKEGNGFVSIETGPDQSPKTIASVRKLVREINDYYGYELVPILHKNIPGNSTECGNDIDITNYQNVGLTPKPTTDKTIKQQLNELLVQLTTLIGKL